MADEQFNLFCQQVLAGKCAVLLAALEPDGRPSDVEGLMTTEELYTVLHSLQLNADYLASPDQPVQALLHSQGVSLCGLSSDSRGKLLFIDTLFENMSRDERLDACFARPLLQLKIVLCKLFVMGKLFKGDESEAIETLINTLANLLMGYWSGDAALNIKKQKEGLFETTQVILKNYYDDYGVIARQTEIVCQIERKQLQRAKKLERRNIDAELGRIKLGHSEEVIADLYNSHFVKMRLPLTLYELLTGIWYDVLLRILLRKNESKPIEILWRKAAQATSLMMRSVQQGAHLKSFFSRAENLDDEVSYIMKEIGYKGDDITELVGGLLHCQKNMVEGGDEEYVQPDLIKKGRYFEKVHFSVSGHLKEKLSELELGNWYLCQSPDSEKKLIKLAHKDEHIDRVLFVNMNGKITYRSFDELAFHLSAGFLKPVQTADFFQHHVSQVLLDCWSLVNQDQTKCLAHQDESERSEIKNRQVEKDDIEQKTTEIRGLRNKLTGQGAQKQALKKSENEAESLLPLGSWITIRNGDASPQHAKLAVIGVSLGELVFVDRTGMRVAKYSRQLFVEKIKEEEISVLFKGDDFNLRLAGVVGRLSRT